MNTNHPNENDPALRAALREWRVCDPLPPQFQEQVWRRIERAETPTVVARPLWSLMNDWVAALLPRPALAVAYVTVLLVIGATAGWSQAREETARTSQEMSARYVRTVDPYQAVR